MKLTVDQQKLVEHNLGLVGKVIRDKVYGLHQLEIYEYCDLFQIGCLGLCQAAATYRGGTFSTYAYRLIWNEICDALVHESKRRQTELRFLENKRMEETVDPLEQVLIQAPVQAGLRKAKARAKPNVRKGIEALEMQLNGYKCREIGAIMNRPANHVAAWMTNGRKCLRQQAELWYAWQLLDT